MSITKARTSLTRTKFQAYLDAQPARKHAGVLRKCGACPIAVYLGKHTSLDISVGIINWRIDGKSKKLPNWAHEFIQKIDYNLDKNHITFGRCAEILRSL